MSTAKKLLGPFKQLICLSETPLKGALKDSQADVIENGGVLIVDDRIEKVGYYSELNDAADDTVERVFYQGTYICLPSYCDAHTHICSAGSRANDYALRNSGVSYLEIAKAGGGIWSTVNHTRKATEAELVDGILKRAELLIQQGITTIEVKSGYGLSVEEEIKMLQAIQKAKQSTPADLIPTCLAAHIKPKDFEGSHEDYLKHIATDLLPLIKQKSLCSRVDVFIEEEAFSADISTDYLRQAKSMGFDITIHADQFTTGGSEVAVKVGALSADHLEVSGDEEIERLASSDVVAIALPGASLGLGCSFTPARKLLDKGASLAIATDWNPGSAPMGDLMTQACILATFEKLSNIEVLSAITFRAASALRKSDTGRLKTGFKADLVVYKLDHYNEIFYHQGSIRPEEVWKSGQKIV